VNYRVTLSPPTDETGIRVIITSPHHTAENFGTMQFWRSWMEYNATHERKLGSRLNWNALFGLAVTISVSAAFWTGMGFLIAHVWR